jgi:hypothetical protein
MTMPESGNPERMCGVQSGSSPARTMSHAIVRSGYSCTSGSPISRNAVPENAERNMTAKKMTSSDTAPMTPSCLRTNDKIRLTTELFRRAVSHQSMRSLGDHTIGVEACASFQMTAAS